MSGLRSPSVSRSARRVLAAAALTTSLFAAVLIAGPAAEGSTLPAPAATTTTPTTGPPNPSPFPPGPPSHLVATSVTTGSISLSWTASPGGGCCGVAGYDIFWGVTFNDVFTSTRLGNVTTTTITTGIRPKTEYFFQVTARDDLNHVSTPSNKLVVITPAADTGSDIVPPSAPGGLTKGAVTTAGLPLSWSPSTDNVGVLAYDVYSFDGWFTSTVVGTTTATSYTVPATVGGAQFYVRARDTAGNISISSNTVAGAGTTPTPTPTPTTSPPPPAPTCSVAYAVTSQWVHGFVAKVTVTNTGPAAINGWTLGFTVAGTQKVSSAWNGTVSQTGAAVTVKNARWNGALASGASTTIGLQGSWSGSNPAPSAFTLNGLPCAAA